MSKQNVSFEKMFENQGLSPSLIHGYTVIIA